VQHEYVAYSEPFDALPQYPKGAHEAGAKGLRCIPQCSVNVHQEMHHNARASGKENGSPDASPSKTSEGRSVRAGFYFLHNKPKDIIVGDCHHKEYEERKANQICPLGNSRFYF